MLLVGQYASAQEPTRIKVYNESDFRALSIATNTEGQSYNNAIGVLQGNFVLNDKEYQKYCNIDILFEKSTNCIGRMEAFANCILHEEFYKQVRDIVSVGLKRYEEKYANTNSKGELFSLYEKYSRRDVCLLMNKGKDISSTMYGMSRIGEDTFIFVTYHKESVDDKEYVDGKPDYADSFENNMIFNCDTQIGNGVGGEYVKKVLTAKRRHLLVQKSGVEQNFYYIGLVDVVDVQPAKKKNNSGIIKDLAKIKMKLHHPVRDDLLKYFESSIVVIEDNAV